MGQIYILENKINGKVYVGQTTKSVEKRLYQHIRAKYYIGRALRKYGIDNFEQYIYIIPDFLLDYCEIEMIKRLNTISPAGYNLESGGNKNKYLSAETRRKISENHADVSGEKHPMYGRHHSLESRRKISEANSGEKNYMYGKHLLESTKRKISAAQRGEKNSMFGRTGEKCPNFGRTGENNPMYGKHHSPETRKLMSEKQKGKHNPRARPVYCVETGEIFDTIKEAANKYDVSHIGDCCRRKRKTAGGYHWEYKE